MYTDEPLAKSRSNEPDADNPNPERRRRRKRSTETDNPELIPNLIRAAIAQLRKRLEILKICPNRNCAVETCLALPLTGGCLHPP